MIRLIDDYVVEPGPYDYMLAKDTGRVNKKGERVLKAISYHASLEKAIQALRGYCMGKCLAEKDMSLSEAVSVVQRCDERFRKLLVEVMEGRK